ncbi:hypothetical protein N7470_006751 [Penicillium chermesinum]|nr:hypothetical protein N7470_006751 [Penicillium chermesinum]
MSGHAVKRRKLSPESNDPQGKRKDDASKNHLARKGKQDQSAELATATGFYKSNFFKLQMDELLTGLRPNYDKQVSKFQDILHKLKDVIESLPERSPQFVPEAEKELRTTSEIVIPWPEPRPAKDVKYTMSYAKPANINVVGSFTLRNGAKTTDARPVDLAVTMPNSIFQEKDYVNYRFFHKRAYYIACIAAGIQEISNELALDVRFGFQDGDSLRPIILLEPLSTSKAGKGSSQPKIRILTAIDPQLFPITKTLPGKCNIRQGSTAGQTDSGESTPFYNASLRSEAAVALFHKHLHSTAQKTEGLEVSNGQLLFLLFEGGGPSGQPVLLRSYSSYQIFKATMQFIAGRDLSSPLILFANDISAPEGGPVLYDGRRGLNILYKMTPWTYKALRHEASITLKMLNESREDNFDRVFIFKVDEPALRFDRLIHFPSAFNGDTLRALRLQNTLHTTLLKAFGDRVKLISLSSQCAGSWPVRSKALNKKASHGLSVGFLLDADNVGRVVDHGPPAEEKEEAAAFREFWGRSPSFDGSKMAASWKVWCGQISNLRTPLYFKYWLSEDDFDFTGDEYDQKLLEEGDGVLTYSSSPFQSINEAFKELERSIGNMEEVPLTIRHLAPATPLLRYTALRVQGHGGGQEPADVALQFESSSRWPDDFAAIQMTKAAFLLKIGDCLKSSGAASSCQVGLENESSKILNNAYLDIVHNSGFLFRLRIHHDREQTLLERRLKNKTISPREREEVAFALFKFKQLFVHAPRLTQAMRSLCTRFPLLSPTIRLVKHWFNSHLFSTQISEELIELLTVRIFTQPSPWDCPSSIMTGFLRTLHLLSRWDWHQEPFIVDVSGDLTPEVTETIRTRFTAWRNIDPAMNTVALFVASDIDTDGVTWTQYEMPSKVVAGRMSVLAKAAINLLKEQSHDMDPSDLFQTSLAPYDFVIHLQPKFLGAPSAPPPKFKNLAGMSVSNKTSKLAIVKSFAHDVHACYGQNLLLFHGDDHCPVIAGVWNPQSLKPRSWNLKTAYSTYSAGSDEQQDRVVINKPAILNEIARLGEGLIHTIETNIADKANV